MFFLFNNNCIFSQINRVQNPSFEVIDSCNYLPNQVHTAHFWDTLRAGGGGGPDLFNACKPYLSGLSVPSQGDSYQIPRTGISYIEFGVYQVPSTNYPIIREYIQNQLFEKLDSGKQYCVKLYVSLFNSAQYAVDRLGAYFDDGSVSTTPFNVATVTPQVESSSGTFLNDTLNWILISGLYIANGTEKYLTMGNFHDNATTNLQWYDPSAMRAVAAYYVDDVSVIDFNLPAWAGKDTIIYKGDSVFIGRQPEIGLECTWHDTTGNVIGIGAGMWVHPDSTTTYIVEQNLCGNIKKDTVKVTVMPLGVNEINGNIEMILFPNPSDGHFAVHLSDMRPQNMKLEIYNVLGKRIYNSEIKKQESEIDISNQPCGIYFLQLINNLNGVQSVHKLVIQK